MATAMKLSEKEFMQQVTELATRRGWHWLHINQAMYGDNWRTPYSGDLGRGWPDLYLCRGQEQLFIELKVQGNKATSEQERVLALLGVFGLARVYYPNDWDLIEQVLA